MRVLFKAPGAAPEIQEIEHSLETMQGLVGGLLTTAHDPELDEAGVTIWANDEGLMLEMKHNFLDAYHQMIVGPVFFSSHDDEGETTSLSDKQLELAQAYCRAQPKPITGWLG